MRISAYTPRAIWRRHMLYNRTGMRLLSTFNHLRWRTIDIPVLLWPPAHEFFGMIEAEIRAEEQIVAASDHLIDPQRFEEFVQRVYAIDFASPRKIALKIDKLTRSPLIVRVLTVRFRRPTMEVQDLLNRLRCKDVHGLKDAIRSRYRDRIDNYVFDIIIHSTETATQGAAVKQLLVEYATVVDKDEAAT
jgi:hypothetical protein